MSVNTNIKDFYEKQYARDTNIAQIPKVNDFMYAQVLSQILPYLKPGLKVLDLGCNNGNLSLFMARMGCNVLGMDLAGNAIDSARRSAEYYGITNAKFECTDFLEEWNTPEEFELVVCSHVIEHVPQDDLFLDKIFFSMQKNSNLILLTPAAYSSLAYVSKLFFGKFAHDEAVGHLRRYRKEKLIDMAKKAGFCEVNTVFLDGILREWFILCWPLTKFIRILALPFVRKMFNTIDMISAQLLFPSTICIHCHKNLD